MSGPGPRESLLTVIANFRAYGLKDRAFDAPVGTSIPVFRKNDAICSHLQCVIVDSTEYNKLVHSACIAYYFAYTNGEIPGGRVHDRDDL
jgi:hypothetical protein